MEPQPHETEAPKKRKYTLTEKARQARLHNLERANAVPDEIRYRHTPKREAANRLSLPKARQEKKRRREAGLECNVRFGHTCGDPRQALHMLGLQGEDYDRAVTRA